jgi:site-specific DNA-methyltransferase (adenine-specific)
MTVSFLDDLRTTGHDFRTGRGWFAVEPADLTDTQRAFALEHAAELRQLLEKGAESSPPALAVVEMTTAPTDTSPADAMADTPAVVVVQAKFVPTAAPLVAEVTVAPAPAFALDDPRTELYHGDCRQVLATQLSASADACITDPPYNIGLTYNGDYDDGQADDVFLRVTLEPALRQVYRVLKPTGCLFLFMGVRLQAETLVLCKQLGFHLRNTIIWHYTFGPAQKGKFTPSYTPCHYLVKDPKDFTFNDDAVRVPSARQLKYNDKRANAKGKVPDDVWVLLPNEQAPDHFRPDSDVWLESRVCGTFKERAGHVTQLPLAVVERIVKVATNPGDLIVEPFAGTATVLVAARKLGRRSIGIEQAEQALAIARGRLEKETQGGQP